MSTVSEQLYEREGLFGDERQFFNMSNRLEKLRTMVGSIERAPTNILDLGCGTGYFAHELKELFPAATVWGVDVSEKALAIGTRRYPQVQFQRADAEVGLPFASALFDLVISGEHIEHLRDVDTYLSEIVRVLKPQGTMVLTTPNLASWLNRLLLLFGKQPLWLEPSLRKTFPIVSVFGKTFPDNLAVPPSGHLRLFTLDMLKKLLAAYGLNVTTATGSSLLGKPFLKQVDALLSEFPSLAIGLVVKVKKGASISA